MQDITVRQPAQSYELVLNETIYRELMEQLLSTQAQAYFLRTRAGDEVEAGINKAIGMMCMTEIVKTRRKTGIPGITAPFTTPDEPRLGVELAEKKGVTV